jgi:radical SAM superfamily enzyme YgiQ (UPF0313 family)
MRVLLLNPPSKGLILKDLCCSDSTKADYYWAPIDLIAISGRFKEQDLTVIDANVLQLSKDETYRQIIEAKPELIIFLTSTITIREDLDLLGKVKEENGTKIIAMGDICYFAPAFVLKTYPKIDGVIMDFTTEHIDKLISAICNKKKLTGKINDIAYREGKKIKVFDLDRRNGFTYPTPHHKKFPLKHYRFPWSRYEGNTSILTNYGCPFKCTFCPSGHLNFKFRDIDSFMAEWKYLHSIGIKEVYMRDLTFGVGLNRAKEICRRIIDSGCNRIVWSCEARVDSVDEELLGLMKKCGCYLIMFGVESGSERILKETNKGITKEQIKKVFGTCKEKGIQTLGHFIIGLPGETKEDILQTISFSKEIECDYAAFNFFVPRYGTDLRKSILEQHEIKDESMDSSNEGTSFSEISKDELTKLHSFALRSFYLRPSHLIKLITNIKTAYQLVNIITNGLTVMKKSI